jgi:hypothetical protein
MILLGFDILLFGLAYFMVKGLCESKQNYNYIEVPPRYDNNDSFDLSDSEDDELPPPYIF